MPVWPAGLPQIPVASGYSEQNDASAVREFVSSAGVSETSPRVTKAREFLSVTFDLRTSQVAIFKTYLQTDLAHGAISFEWVHPITNVEQTFKTKSWRLVPLGPDDYALSLNLEQIP